MEVKKTYTFGFRKTIVTTFLILYVISFLITFYIFNIFNEKNVKTNLQKENRYSSEVVKDFINKKEIEVSLFARSINGGNEIYQALLSNKYVYITRENLKDKTTYELKEMNRMKYIQLITDLSKRINYTNLYGAAEKQISIMNKEYITVVKTPQLKIEDLDTKDDKYVIDQFTATEDIWPGLKTGFMERKNDKLFFKGLDRVYGNGEAIGLSIITERLDNVFIDNMKKIVNKEVFLIVDDKIVVSTVDRGVEKTIDIGKLKNNYGIIKIDSKQYGINLIPLYNYNRQIIGYVGVGFRFDNITISKTDLFYYLGFLAVSSLLIVISLLIILKKLFNPFGAIIEGIKSIENGKYTKIDITAKNELKLIAENINALSYSVEKREKELIELNMFLEEKVEERTDSLKQLVKDQRMGLNILTLIQQSIDTDKVLAAILEGLKEQLCLKYIGYWEYEINSSGNICKLVPKRTLGLEQDYKDLEIIPNTQFETFIKNNKINESMILTDENQIAKFSKKICIMPISYGNEKKYGMIITHSFHKEFENDLYIIKTFKMNLASFLYKTEIYNVTLKNKELSTLVQLASSIVHEVKTPLVVIKGLSGIIKRKYSADEKLVDYISKILLESERIDGMAQDLLEYAGHANYIYKFEEIRLSDVLDKVLKNRKDDIEANNIQVKTNIEVESFVCDFNKMYRVLDSIIKNSIENSSVELDEKLIKIDAAVLDESIKINIWDNGVGIPGDMIQNVFRPLVTTKIQGTGLGLTVSKNIINKFGGEIEINSVQNSWTECSISIPLDVENQSG